VVTRSNSRRSASLPPFSADEPVILVFAYVEANTEKENGLRWSGVVGDDFVTRSKVNGDRGSRTVEQLDVRIKSWIIAALIGSSGKCCLVVCR